MGDPLMQNRRDFVRTMAGATAGFYAAGRTGFAALAQAPAAPVKRREVFIGGKRIKVIDMHGHCAVPDVASVLKGTPLERSAPAATGSHIIGPDRIRILDEQGIDVQVLTQQGAWWYAVTDRELARQIVKIQNERTAAWVAAYPDRFVALASVSLQFPDLAAEQLEDGVKRLGMRGGAVSAGSVAGKELSAPEFDPFWARAQALGVVVFTHPGGDTRADGHLVGKGNLGNTIGNPLETTILLSHLIFDGTLDKFPGLKICAAHAGGYIPSYLGRSEAACTRQPNACDAKKRPFDAYFKDQIMADSMIFREEGLRHMVEEMGAGQIVYGTDIPFAWPVDVDFILKATFLTDAQKEGILGGNAMKQLHI
jgi:aminocarboxymuconate-semialdehyde decarboxylase